MSNKTYALQIVFDEEEHALLKAAQAKRKAHGLPFLSLDKIVKLYMLEGLFQRVFLEQKEQRT